jgi:hypothetical protein
MVRRLLAFFLLAAACTRPQPANVAVTITRPAESAPAKIEDHTQERIAAAKVDITEGHYDAASHALLAIVCGDRIVHGWEDLARCPATPFVNTSEAWALIGELALDNHLELAQTEWGAARRVVTKWDGHTKGVQLEVAEVALAHATRLSASPKYAFQLATTRDKLHRYGPALEAYAKVLDSGGRTHRNEAIEGAAHCITYFDWDGDGEKDSVLGFDRPEVQNALAASSQPWVAEVSVRALDALIDTDECAAARTGATDLARRFPQNPNISRINAQLQSCP